MINVFNTLIAGLIFCIPILLSLTAVIISFWNSWNHANSLAVASYLEMTSTMSSFGRRLWEITKPDWDSRSDKDLESAKRDYDFEMIGYLTFLNDYCLLINKRKISCVIRSEITSVIKKFLIKNLHESSLYKYIFMYWESDDEELEEIQSFCAKNDIPGFPNRPTRSDPQTGQRL